MSQYANNSEQTNSKTASDAAAAEPGWRGAMRQSLNGMGYDAQSAALSPTNQAVQLHGEGEHDHDHAATTLPHMDPARNGIFLVGWTAGQVSELIRGMAGFAGLTCAWNPTTFELTFVGVDNARKQARIAEGRWSQEMHDAWTAALVDAPRHSVVIGAQEGDTDSVQGGYAGPNAMVLDMMDLGTFAGETDRVEQSFNIYWVMTHELLGHFYLGLGHGRENGYESYNIDTYDYKHDKTLQKMNEWRMQMGLPVRLQHPPKIEGQHRTYIFVDAYPDQPTIDLDATAPDATVSLPPMAERKQRFDELRAKVQNKLDRPDDVDIRFYPTTSYTDDDTDAQGHDLPGRGNLLPLLRWGSRGGKVTLAQNKINEHGVPDQSGQPLDPDGIFGRKTYHATRDFQGTHECKVDGLIGPETWSALLGYQVMTREEHEARRAGHRAHNHGH